MRKVSELTRKGEKRTTRWKRVSQLGRGNERIKAMEEKAYHGYLLTCRGEVWVVKGVGGVEHRLYTSLACEKSKSECEAARAIQHTRYLRARCRGGTLSFGLSCSDLSPTRPCRRSHASSYNLYGGYKSVLHGMSTLFRTFAWHRGVLLDGASNT